MGSNCCKEGNGTDSEYESVGRPVERRAERNDRLVQQLAETYLVSADPSKPAIRLSSKSKLIPLDHIPVDQRPTSNQFRYDVEAYAQFGGEEKRVGRKTFSLKVRNRDGGMVARKNKDTGREAKQNKRVEISCTKSRCNCPKPIQVKDGSKLATKNVQPQRVVETTVSSVRCEACPMPASVDCSGPCPPSSVTGRQMSLECCMAKRRDKLASSSSDNVARFLHSFHERQTTTEVKKVGVKCSQQKAMLIEEDACDCKSEIEGLSFAPSVEVVSGRRRPSSAIKTSPQVDEGVKFSSPDESKPQDKRLLLIDQVDNFFALDSAAEMGLVNLYSPRETVLLEFDQFNTDEAIKFMVDSSIEYHDLVGLEINVCLKAADVIRLISAFIYIHRTLEEVTFRSNEPVDDVLKFLGLECHMLKKVLLNRAPLFFESSLEDLLQKCNGLQVLHLSRNTCITGRSLGLLPRSMSELSLKACPNIDDKGLTYLVRGQGKRSLRTLAIGGFESTGADRDSHLMSLGEIAPRNDRHSLAINLMPYLLVMSSNLTRLSLVNVKPPLSDSDLILLTLKFPRLISLELDDCTQISDVSMKAVARQWRDLQELRLSFSSRITSTTMDMLAQLENLKLVSLHEFSNIKESDIVSLVTTSYQLRQAYFRISHHPDNIQLTEDVLLDGMLMPRDERQVSVERFGDTVVVQIYN